MTNTLRFQCIEPGYYSARHGTTVFYLRGGDGEWILTTVSDGDVQSVKSFYTKRAATAYVTSLTQT